ncbi:MAG: hypothetical protein WC842_00245 [Candidatus Paceibacterota bacterium]|jgi:hypothetical protein
MARTDPETGKLVLSLAEYLELEKKEILGADNMYYASQKLGRTPTREEAAEHYVTHGGAKVFGEKYILEGRLKRSEKNEDKK